MTQPPKKPHQIQAGKNAPQVWEVQQGKGILTLKKPPLIAVKSFSTRRNT